jgi:hypothetical protein
LGHRSIATTLRVYVGMETAAALRHDDTVILGWRQEAAGTKPGQGPG